MDGPGKFEMRGVTRVAARVDELVDELIARMEAFRAEKEACKAENEQLKARSFALDARIAELAAENKALGDALGRERVLRKEACARIGSLLEKIRAYKSSP